MNVYIIGSLKNPQVAELGNRLRGDGFDVFEDWFAAGPDADDRWRDYEQARGHTLKQALEGYAARHVFEYDKEHLDEADVGILVLPAGRSGHTEMGYLAGRKTPTFILLDGDPERWDVMYCFASAVFDSEEALRATLLGWRTLRAKEASTAS